MKKNHCSFLFNIRNGDLAKLFFSNRKVRNIKKCLKNNLGLSTYVMAMSKIVPKITKIITL